MKETPAKGTEGFIIWSPNFDRGEITGGTFVFRVYREADEEGNKPFKDYDIYHCDLAVTITDKSAAFFEDEEKLKVDYSTEYRTPKVGK